MSESREWPKGIPLAQPVLMSERLCDLEDACKDVARTDAAGLTSYQIEEARRRLAMVQHDLAGIALSLSDLIYLRAQRVSKDV